MRRRCGSQATRTISINSRRSAPTSPSPLRKALARSWPRTSRIGRWQSSAPEPAPSDAIDKHAMQCDGDAMTYEAISVTPCSPHIGAEIGDIDLTKPLSNQQVAELHQAFTDHLVIFF